MNKPAGRLKFAAATSPNTVARAEIINALSECTPAGAPSTHAMTSSLLDKRMDPTSANS